MILEEKSFRIKKITKEGEFWKLFPKGSKTPILLSVDSVYGNLPPCRKLPWQCHNLTIKTISGKYTVYAEMDGLVLFNIPKDKYSDDIKREIRRIEKIEADYAEFQKQYTDTINAQLSDFLPKVPKVADLEDEINKLSVCWRAYFRPRLSLQYESDDVQQRLFLMYHLVKIADRLYRRHTDVDAPLSVAFRSIEFSICDQLSETFTNDIVVELMENDPSFRNNKSFILFNEIRCELKRVLPPAEHPLDLYLVQVVHRLLSDYSVDYADLVCRRPRDIWGETINTDNDSYRFLCQEMKLPYLSSLIIENKFTKEDIKHLDSVF